MNGLKHFSVLVLAVSAALSAARAAPPEVAIEPAEQQKLGVETLALSATTAKASTPAYIRVLDPGALGALDAEIAAADAAAKASTRERDRLARLAAADASASRQAAEAAEAQAAGDAARALALRQQLSVNWSPALAAMPASERTALIAQFVSGEAALIRADAYGTDAFEIGEVTINDGDKAPITAKPLGRSGAVDPRMQTFGVLAVVTGKNAQPLAPGRALEGAIASSADIEGVLIPRSAIIRLDGADWVYVQTADAAFERREISGAMRTSDGWFVKDGFKAGDKIAVKNAGALLGVERTDESAEAD